MARQDEIDLFVAQEREHVARGEARITPVRAARERAVVQDRDAMHEARLARAASSSEASHARSSPVHWSMAFKTKKRVFDQRNEP